MTKLLTRTGALLALMLIAVAAPAAAQADVSGTWTLSVQAPEAQGDITAIFTQEGSTVEGALDVPMVGGAEMTDGKVEGNTFSFQLHVDFDGQWFSIDVEAEVDGDDMSGEFYVPEMGAMAFTAKRATG